MRNPAKGETPPAAGRGRAATRVAAAAGLCLLAAAALACLSLAMTGLDLFPVWAAGWLAESGRLAEVYVYRPGEGPELTHPAWREAARIAGHEDDVYGFVFPPLWARLAGLAAAGAGWETFRGVMAWVNAAAMIGVFAAGARLWAAEGRRLTVLTLSAVPGALAWPVASSAVFNQVQPLVMLAALLAFAEGERDRPARAGLLLALAASVKLSPAVFGLYWLLTGRWRAAGWAAAGGAALFALSLAVAGGEATRMYFEQLARLGAGVSTGHPNQSLQFAIAALTAPLPPDMMAFPVAPSARALALLAGAGMIAAAAWRWRGSEAAALRLLPVVMIGCLLAAPIAWTHYFAFLVPLVLALPGRIAGGGPVAVAALAILIGYDLWFWIDPPAAKSASFATLGVALAVAGTLILAPGARGAGAPAAPRLRRPRAPL